MTLTHTWHAALATRQGTRAHNADAAALATLPDGSLAAAIVDGIGSNAEVAAYSALAAQVAARVGVRKTAILGLLAAAELNAGPGGVRIDPDGVGVLAVARPDGAVSIAWTGDARAYTWDGTGLHPRTTDMTVGEYLRANGFPLEATTAHDDWIRTSLGRSSIATVHLAVMEDARLLILTSDGVHKQITGQRLAEIVAAHADADPQALADAIVAAPETGPDGYRDDATAIVLRAGTLPLTGDRLAAHLLEQGATLETWYYPGQDGRTNEDGEVIDEPEEPCYAVKATDTDGRTLAYGASDTSPAGALANLATHAWRHMHGEYSDEAPF